MLVLFWISIVMVILMVLGFFWNGLTLQMIVSESVILLGILIARKILRGRIHASVIHGLWGLLVLRLFLVIPVFFVGTGAMPNCSRSVNRQQTQWYLLWQIWNNETVIRGRIWGKSRFALI